jgi:tetratricopeptide (TPR) repeat protein
MKHAVLLILTLLCFSPIASAQALSKQDILKLSSGGVADEIIIQKVQQDGIAFDMSADTILELRNAGLPNGVIKALISAKVSKTQTVPSIVVPDTTIRAQELYKAGKYGELADYLKKILSANPLDYKARTFLILCFLKLGDSASADHEFSELKNNTQDANARRYVEKVENLLALLEKQKEGKARLLTALKSFNAQEASTDIEQLAASPLQKEFLTIILDSYSGNFESAHARLSKLSPDSLAARQQLKAIGDRVNQTQDDYTKALARVDVYIHSPYAPSSCFPPSDMSKHADYYKLTVAESLNSVSSLVRSVPLNDFALNMLFHAEMLVGDYQEVENLGDRLLSAKGNISLPFFSRDKYFDVVIDVKKRRLYSVVSPQAFLVQYPENGSSWTLAPYHQGQANHNDWNASLIPFDLPFAEVTSVSQHVPWGRTTGEYIKGRPYALKLSPTGQAPNYAVMLLLGCTAGYDAQMRATHNLGQYIVHVIGKKDLQTELVDPSKKPSDYSWILGAMTAFYGGAAIKTGNAAIAEAMTGDN